MGWRHVEASSERIRFVQEAVSGERAFSSLCASYGISRPTGYLWLKRFREGGVAAMVECSRRPSHSPTRIAAETAEQIVALRQRYPEWGARKLSVLLAREGLLVPRMTVHRVLERRGLLHELDRHAQAPGRFCREQPNQLWQMDFKSPKGWGTHLGPLSVIDDHSRYVIALQQLRSGRAEHVQQRLERAFADCGVPEAMLMDHGQPWFNAQSSGGWTQLSVWLMRVGVRLYYSGVRHPQTQGKVERFHGALEKARRRRGHPAVDPQAWLDGFRDEYNHVRPHEALAMKTPASVWRPSASVYLGPRDPTYAAGSEVRQLNSLGALRLHGRNWQVAGALAHQPVLLQRIDQRVLIFYANTLLRELDLAGCGSTMVDPDPANFLNL
jgi:transposase InsO family protein